jgi:voltage-gated potassium channel Kch
MGPSGAQKTGKILLVGETELASEIDRVLRESPATSSRVERVLTNGEIDPRERIDPPAVMILAGNKAEENLALALEALDRWPETRLVLRFFNKALGEELERLSPRIRVLSASEISGPAFAAHALSAEIQSAWRGVDGKIWVSRKNEGEPALLRPHLKPKGKGRPFESVPVSFLQSMREFLRDPWVLRVLFGIFALIFSASVYFQKTLGIALEDAVYFVVTTLTTTGYGDISLLRASLGAKFAGILVMLGGTTLSAVLFALISDRLFEMRLATTLGRWPVPSRGHVVVVGVGDVGVRVCETLLDLEAPLVAIEKNSEGRFVAQMRSRRVPMVVADATVSSTLEFAQVRHAAALVCLTDHDLVNVEVALNARRLNPGIRVVVRIQDPDFASSLGNRLGVDVALSSATLAAPKFVEEALSLPQWRECGHGPI